MMKKGIMVFNHEQQNWKIWIGQQPYWVEQGDTLELRIQHIYFEAYVEKDMEWFVTLKHEVRFVLHPFEIYKVRIKSNYLIPVNAPF